MATLTADFLENVPIFRGMSEQERSQLLQVMRKERCPKDEEIVCSGAESRGLHLIVEGGAMVVLDVYSPENPLIEEGVPRAFEHPRVDQLGVGSVFGELSFFGGGPHSATVRATSDVQLLTLPAQTYEGLLARGSLAAYKLALNAASILAQRLRKADEMIGDLVLARHDPLTRWEWFEGHLQIHTGRPTRSSSPVQGIALTYPGG